MRSVFKRLGSLIAIFCVLFLFQNCGKQLSVFSGHGNGDPYEGLTSGDSNGSAPVADFTIHYIEYCTASDPKIQSLLIYQLENSPNARLQVEIINWAGDRQLQSIPWLEDGSVNGQKSMNWYLDEGVTITGVLIQPSYAEVHLQTPNGDRFVPLICRPAGP